MKKGNKKPKTTPQHVERRVRFYRLVQQDLSAAVVNWNRVLVRLRDGDAADRLIESDAAANVRFDVHSVSEPYRLTLTGVRKNALPLLVHDNGGERHIDADPCEGVGERTHISIQEGVIAVECNGNGPRAPTWLMRFLLRGSDSPLVDVRMADQIRGADLDRVAAGQEMAVFTLKIPGDLVYKVREHDESLADGLTAVRDHSEAETIELVVRRRVTKKSKKGLALSIAQMFGLASALYEDRNRCTLEMTMKEVGDRSVLIDLLGDPIVLNQKFATEGGRSRRIITVGAFETLEAAYTSARRELRSAVSLC